MSSTRNPKHRPAAPTRPAQSLLENLEERRLFSVPNGPFGAVATAASPGEVDVAWHSNSTGETGFQVQRAAAGGSFQPVGTTGTGQTTYADHTATAGTSYTYRVLAYDGGGDSSTTDTNAVGLYFPTSGSWGGVPNGPFGLQAAATPGGGVTIAWHTNSNNEAGFRVERAVWGGNFQPLGTTAAGATSFNDSSAAAGVSYSYRVKAYNAAGDSSYTNVDSATPAGAAASTAPVGNTGSGPSWVVPNGPFGLAVTSAGASQVTLAWYTNSNNEAGFRIERRTPGGSYAPVGTVAPGVTTFTDSGVSAGTSYVYRVSAYNLGGISNYTNEVTAGTGGGSPGAANNSALLGPVAAPSDGTTPPAGFFPIIAFDQGESTFATWKSRGINTLWNVESDPRDLELWNSAAVANGFWMIRNPRANPADDVNQKNLLAWATSDEPEINGTNPAVLASTYAQLKAADPSKPVIINFSGANVIYPFDSLNQPLYQQYITSADWVSSDTYPLNTYSAPQYIDNSIPLPASDPVMMSNGLRWNNGNAEDVLRQWTGGKKQFAFIETSKQNIPSPFGGGQRAPTPDEFRGEVWDAIIHGAKGVAYFPQSFKPDVSDATPADVAAEMTKQDALITSVGPVLSNVSDSTSNPMSLGGGLEGTYRYFNGHTYFFVLNFSHTAAYGQTIKLPGVADSTAVTALNESRQLTTSGGAIVDNFAPYQLHVYQV